MNKKRVRIGGASGYWGDTAQGAVQLVRQGEVDYLVFDYLAEVTMSILAKARSKSEELGYATDFITHVLKPLVKEIAAKRIRIVANAGGVNLKACQRAIRQVIDEAGVALCVGIVEGDNLLDRDQEFRSAEVKEMFTAEPFPKKTASINAYLGAFPIAAALDAGADIVITGRVVDSAVTLGPLIHEFRWRPEDFDRLAAGTLAGHLIECGCQVTGGNFTDWERVCDDWDRMGFPIAECDASGEFVITKPEGTGGLVSFGTVAEQLLYEIGDPQAYIVPDAICDFSQVTLTEEGSNRVRVAGVRGYPPTSTYKVCATYPDGYRATFIQTATGFAVETKAQKMGAAILSRCCRLFTEFNWPNFRRARIDLIGANALWNPAQIERSVLANELVLRISVHHDRWDAVDLFSKEAAGSSLSMTTGRCAAGAPGRPKVSPVVRLFSFLWNKVDVPITVDVDGVTVSCVALDLEKITSKQAVAIHPVNAEQIDFDNAITVPLVKLALARSGDKGDDANIGVIARSSTYLPYLRAELTPARIATWFAHVLQGEVERYDLPGIRAMNFVLRNALGDGGVASLNVDAQGKTYAQQLLAMPIRVPRDLVFE